MTIELHAVYDPSLPENLALAGRPNSSKEFARASNSDAYLRLHALKVP
jgi:hypothetical protein